jgi:hypothetical protein
MENFIQIGAGLIVITALILSNRKEDLVETFASLGSESQIASVGAMPRNNIPANSGLPLFLNLYPKFGSDFRLFDLIQKLKLNNSSPIWNGIYKPGSGARNLFESKKLPPIILVPGLGASPLYARWNKSSGSPAQTVDESGDFQQNDAWSCKQVQNSWVQIWPPDIDGLASYCWADNTKVTVDGDKIVNVTGVNTTTQEFGSIEFANDDYMATLIDALESAGYQEGTNLFAACYDFRKIGDPNEIDAWCLSLTKLIEQHCAMQENPAIIIGHDLGAVVANYFLVNAMQEWKDRFIDKFISVSGTFGGCPKALRAVLSGVSAPGNAMNFNTAIKASSGLSLMLPNPKIYGDNPMIQYNQLTYSSKDIPKLVETVSGDAAKVLKVSEKVRDISMKAPGVEVHILAGTDLDTESSYKYNMSLVNEPEKNAPFYQLELPFNQKFSYPDYFTGDGTMPKFALEYPIWWSKSQPQPVYFQFFTGVEHTKILSTLEPVQYILDACDT